MTQVELAARNTSAAVREAMNVQNAVAAAVADGEVDPQPGTPAEALVEAAREAVKRIEFVGKLLKQRQ